VDSIMMGAVEFRSCEQFDCRLGRKAEKGCEMWRQERGKKEWEEV
jgi:hypothetical protein